MRGSSGTNKPHHMNACLLILLFLLAIWFIQSRTCAVATSTMSVTDEASTKSVADDHEDKDDDEPLTAPSFDAYPSGGRQTGNSFNGDRHQRQRQYGKAGAQLLEAFHKRY